MATWTLTGTTAQLQGDGFSATIDLLQPQRGLHDVTIANAAMSKVEVLGVALPLTSPDELSLPETYVRGHDLVAVYLPTPSRPWRVQAYWRIVESASAGNALVVELQVSINTGLLDVHPIVDVVAHLTGAKSPTNEGEPMRFVLDSTGWSYSQLVHPDDPCRTESIATSQGLQVTQRLFDRFLEKGVILRARVRGAFAQSSVRVDAIFAEFAESPLPLTT